MCGVLGGIGIELSQSDVQLLEHRGPDSSGIERFRVGMHTMHLAHTRLAIQDLTTTGYQPIWSSTERSILSFNGEIYNHFDLRSKVPNVKFRGGGDAETLINYLEEFSIEKLNNLNGIFAFAIAWPLMGRVLLVRDPFGVKPIYYTKTKSGFIFASELRSIIPYITNELNTHALTCLLQLRYVPSPLTLLRGVSKLRPGHFLEIDCKKNELQVIEKPYINRENLGTHDRFRGDYSVNNFGVSLETAVKRQMLSDVEVGVFLSGGIDSAVIAALAQRFSEKPIKAFTVGFDEGGPACEIGDAAVTARILGLEHHVTRIGIDDYLSKLETIVDIVEEPLATSSVVPLYALAELSSDFVKVVLSGQGADESMGGYARYWGECAGGLLPRSIFSLAEKLGLGETTNIQLSRAIRSLSEPDDISRFMKVYSVFSDIDIAHLTDLKCGTAKNLVRYSYNINRLNTCAHSVDRMMSLDLRMGLSDDLLLYTDKITMAHSLECRVPLLDLELVRFIESLPHGHRVNIFGGKKILKQYSNSILPKSLANRKKRGFNSPTNVWLRNRDLLVGQLCEKNSSFSNWFAQNMIMRIIDEYIAGFRPDSHPFLLLVLSYWFDKYIQ